MFDIMFDERRSVIGGSIVNDDNSVILIVLIENRLQVVFVSEVFSVVVRWNDDAEGQLCLVEV